MADIPDAPGDPAAAAAEVAPARRSHERTLRLGHFTDADMRTLVITIAGGLAVNVLTVLVLAAAYLFAKAIRLDYPDASALALLGILGREFVLPPLVSVVCLLLLSPGLRLMRGVMHMALRSPTID